jgi:hypothetical protein
VPGDAVAVVLNVTATDASEPTFFTVWPAGEHRPPTSNLNPVPGLSVPSLVIARLGADGAVNVYNRGGQAQVIVDLTGYLRTGSSSGLAALDPTRVLDTRTSVGGHLGKVGADGVVEVQIAGASGVPADATAAAINVTVTEPEAASYLLVWPSGESRPVASSVNMVPGQTVPNMVLTKLGGNGAISIYNLRGATHVIVDVLGCFVPGASGGFGAGGPVRVLDTRDGTGTGVAARIGGTPLRLAFAGRHGVPVTGVSAVLLNVTAVAPTADTYITVFPGDAAAVPTASNLNVRSGQVIPNMVLGRLDHAGDVQIANAFGETDVVVDLFGWFVD